jgi:hypothetical protein
MDLIKNEFLGVNRSKTFEINETCGAIMVKVMYPKTTANRHNLSWGQNCRVSISIKTRSSGERVVANSMPLLRLLQFSQNRKGYYNFTFDGNSFASNPDITQGVDSHYIGLTGIIALSEKGNLTLNAQDKIDVRITDIPENAFLSIATIDIKGNATTYMKYSEHSMVGAEKNRRIAVQPHHKTIMVPIGDTVEKEYSNAVNSYTNPLDNIQLFFTDTSIQDMRLDRADIHTHNILTSGNDICAFWAKADRKSVARLSSGTLRTIDSLTADAHGEHAQIYFGAFDYGLEDLEGVSHINAYKLTEGDMPYFIEKVKNL